MKHFGDITKLNGAELPVVDIITGGSPCQDLSVAGKRAGLAGERSGLFMDQIRIIKEMREHDRKTGSPDGSLRPRYMVWENVPGAFSSNKGRDFAAVLEETIRIVEPEAPDVPVPPNGWPTAGCLYDELGGWSVAWRVHDAQFWGVPQRRRRISLVADFGGLTAPEILFEREGLSGDSEPGGEEGQGAAAGAESGAGGAGAGGVDCYNGAIDTVAATLGVNCGMSTGRNGVMVLNDQGGQFIAVENHPTDSRVTVSADGKVQTLTSRMGTGGNNVPLVMKIRNDQGGSVMGVSEDVTGALRAEEHGHQPVVAFTQNQRNEVRDLGDIAGALAAEPGVHQQTYVYENHSQDSRFRPLGDICQTVSATYGMGGKPGGGKGILIQHERTGALSTLNNQSVLSAGLTNRGYYTGDVTETLRSDPHGAYPLVSTANAMKSSKTKPCSTEPLLLESNQNHATVQTDGISTALPASMGMGGGYVPMITNTLPRRMDGSPQPDKGNGAPIVATVYGIDQQGGKGGANYAEDVCPPVLSDSHGTPHAVAYGISAYDSNAMKSSNPHSGVYKAETARTLDLNGGSPACHQGGIAVVQKGCDVYNQEITGDVAASLTAASGGTNTSGPKVLAAGFCAEESAKTRSIGYEEELSPALRAGAVPAAVALEIYPIEGNGARPSHQGPGFGEAGDPSYTLNAVERHGVAECAAVDCRNGTEDPNVNGTLQAGGSVNSNNVVRTWGGKRALCADVKFFQTYEETSGALLATQYKDPPITVTTEETT